MANPSFDIVSKVDHQEVTNAVTQTAKELGQRFDFRGVDAGIDWSGDEAINLHAETEERVRAAYEVFRDKLVKRSISLKAVHADEPRQSGKTSRLTAHLKEGIEQDLAKKIGKLIRDEGPKGVQAQIQGDQLRVTAKKKDDLQAVISLLQAEDFDVPLQFTNYR